MILYDIIRLIQSLAARQLRFHDRRDLCFRYLIPCHGALYLQFCRGINDQNAIYQGFLRCFQQKRGDQHSVGRLARPDLPAKFVTYGGVGNTFEGF